MKDCLLELRMFSKLLRLKRHEKELSQEELAELVGCHPNAIGRLERGEATPSFRMIISIANALKISPKDLMP